MGRGTGFKALSDADNPLEKHIEQAVKRYAENKRWKVYKWVSANNRGVLDRIFISSWGDVVFIEFKRKGRKPTELQQRCIETLHGQGCFAHCIDSVESGKHLIDDIDSYGEIDAEA